jgi:branched-chain amino acid transport system ATP-binding protein
VTALLEVKDLHASYGDVRVIMGIDFTVDEGEVVVILGANGAGKTTTLRALSGMLNTSGSVKLAGKETLGMKTSEIVRMGVAHVPQGRGTFSDLTVADNLEAGAFIRKDNDIGKDIDRYYDMFKVLGERRDQPAGSLSGGEQQMLAIARALMSNPTLLLLDEPSLGLAPIIVQRLFDVLKNLNREQGTTILVVEQNAQLALDIAHRGYVIEVGNIAAEGTAHELQTNDAIRRAYLGY